MAKRGRAAQAAGPQTGHRMRRLSDLRKPKAAASGLVTRSVDVRTRVPGMLSADWTRAGARSCDFDPPAEEPGMLSLRCKMVEDACADARALRQQAAAERAAELERARADLREHRRLATEQQQQQQRAAAETAAQLERARAEQAQLRETELAAGAQAKLVRGTELEQLRAAHAALRRRLEAQTAAAEAAAQQLEKESAAKVKALGGLAEALVTLHERTASLAQAQTEATVQSGLRASQQAELQEACLALAAARKQAAQELTAQQQELSIVVSRSRKEVAAHASTHAKERQLREQQDLGHGEVLRLEARLAQAQAELREQKRLSALQELGRQQEQRAAAEAAAQSESELATAEALSLMQMDAARAATEGLRLQAEEAKRTAAEAVSRAEAVAARLRWGHAAAAATKIQIALRERRQATASSRVQAAHAEQLSSERDKLSAAVALREEVQPMRSD